MRYKERYLTKRLELLFGNFPVVAVTGARQVGKTTLVEHFIGAGIPKITFDPVIDIGNARAEPEMFLQNTPVPVFLDEIQYAPELLPVIKRRVDDNREPGQYILSGSQNLSVLKDVAESLAGRAMILHLRPFSYREILEETQTESFLIKWFLSENPTRLDLPQPVPFDNLTERIFKGGFPRVDQLAPELYPDYWQSYMQTYIERDVRRIADIQNLQLFGNFFRLLAAVSGCEMNYAQLGRDLGIQGVTASKWLSVAQATYQWESIPAFSRNPIKRIALKPKGYFSDTGFLCYLLNINSPRHILHHPMLGALVETYIMNEIIKLVQQSDKNMGVYHFRTLRGAEVDCVIEHDGRVYLIEIKTTSRPTKKHLSGFKSFTECFPSERIAGELLICSVEQPVLLSKTCLALPWWQM